MDDRAYEKPDRPLSEKSRNYKSQRQQRAKEKDVSFSAFGINLELGREEGEGNNHVKSGNIWPSEKTEEEKIILLAFLKKEKGGNGFRTKKRV